MSKEKYGFKDAFKVASAVAIVYFVTWLMIASLELGVLKYALQLLFGEA